MDGVALCLQQVPTNLKTIPFLPQRIINFVRLSILHSAKLGSSKFLVLDKLQSLPKECSSSFVVVLVQNTPIFLLLHLLRYALGVPSDLALKPTCQGVFFCKTAPCPQPPIPEITHYKAASTGFTILRLGSCPMQVPPTIGKVTEQKRQTTPRSTGIQRRNQNSKDVTELMNEQESESTTVNKSPPIRGTQSSHTISRFKPFCTLSISAAHPAQGS